MVEATQQFEIVGRLAFAALLGALIGFERDLRGYVAGVRTFSLVALGAALFTEASQLTGEEFRIAAGIVTGIGFLGAGVIIREGQSVRGVTTAATIWASAAVGMAVGLRLFVVAGATALGVFLLLESRPLMRALAAHLRQRLPGFRAEEEE